MAPRPDVSEERKNQIIQAAMKVFSRLGFDSARMDDIVDESGLSKGALYWYFKSKDEIIIAILDFLFEWDIRELKQLPQTKGTAQERLMIFMERSLQEVDIMMKFIPLTYEFYALAFRHKTVQKAMQHYLRSYFEILEPIIQQGVDNGEFRPVDVHQAAVSLGALFEGTLLLWIYDSQTVNIPENIRSGMELLLQGLLADPSPGKKEA